MKEMNIARPRWKSEAARELADAVRSDPELRRSSDPSWGLAVDLAELLHDFASAQIPKGKQRSSPTERSKLIRKNLRARKPILERFKEIQKQYHVSMRFLEERAVSNRGQFHRWKNGLPGNAPDQQIEAFLACCGDPGFIPGEIASMQNRKEADQIAQARKKLESGDPVRALAKNDRAATSLLATTSSRLRS